MTRSLIALLLLALPAAAQAAPWQELKTAHFTLRTDLDVETAIRAAVEIERTRAALLAAMWPPVKDADVQPVDIIVLADGLEYERYAGRGHNGLYSYVALPPRIVLWGGPDRWEVRASGPRWQDSTQLDMPGGNRRGDSQVLRSEVARHLEVVRAGSSSVLRHELAHHLAWAVYGKQPLWFSEGQAQFLESLALGEDGRSATIGRINPTAWAQFMGVRSTTTADVLAWQTPGSQMAAGKTLGLFGTSWQLYQWLFTTRRAGLRCYQERLAEDEPSLAWAACFPDLVPDELDHVLWDFARLGTPATEQVQFNPIGLQVDVRPLSKAEVHLARAHVALTAATATQRPELLAEAREEVDRAVAQDAACVGALRLQAASSPPAVRLSAGRMAVAAHPSDGWAWLLLADALWDTAGPQDERDRAYRKAVELLPDSPLVLGRAARNLIARGERAGALVWAERARRLAPWNGEVLATNALALAALGRCEEGRGMADRAHRALFGGEGVVTTALEEGMKRACPTAGTPDAGIVTGGR